MRNIKGYKISNEALHNWCHNLVPSYDFYYFENLSDAINLLGDQALILTREELVRNPLLFSIDTNNSFTTWNVKREAKHVAVLSNDLFHSISSDKKQKVFHEQWSLGRGLIFDFPLFERLVNKAVDLSKFKENIIQTTAGDKLVLQKHIWDALPKVIKEEIIITLAGFYIEEEPILPQLDRSYEAKLNEEFSNIKDYFDTYPGINGPNCFAAVLAAITPEYQTARWIIHQWIQPETFKLGLQQRSYKNVASSEIYVKGDILVWVSSKGEYLHTAYLLDNNLVFNKHGQTIFNPWQVLYLDTLMQAWDDVIKNGGRIEVLRKD